MGDMYNYETNINVTCGDGGDNHRSSPDDISVFLRQIMSRSSSATSASSSSSFVGPQAQGRPLPVVSVPEDPVPGSSCLPVKDVVSGSDFGYFSGNVVRGNVSSSSVGGGSGNETDEHEYDCESEEGLDVLLDEVPTKSAVPRSSKRSRAAEVHNLSEKRRRSRINEKMKALQNLIPNSNKTDKASMLDEAIDYLKQLQLQVQMLSMRNGINLHPMCLPGLLQPSHVSRLTAGIAEENGPLHMNMTGSFVLNAETPASAMFGLPNHFTSSLQSLSSNTPHEFNPEGPSVPESSIKPQFGAFPLYSPCEANLGEDFLPYQQLDVSHSERLPSELASLPFGRQASNMKDSNNCMEACITGRNQAGGILLKSNDRNPVLSPDLNGIQTGRSALIGGVKMERRGI